MDYRFTRTTWYITRTIITPALKSKKNLFKRIYHCQFKTKINKANLQRQKAHSSKNLDCPAELIIVIKKQPSQTTRAKEMDNLILDWPCVITFKNDHNHTIDSAAALTKRPMGEKTKQDILNLFAKGHSVASAYNTFCLEKMKEFGDEYENYVADRYYFPKKSDFSNLWNTNFKKNYGDRSGDQMLLQSEDNSSGANSVLYKSVDDNSLHEAETSSSFPDHGEGSISTDSTDHPLGGYDRKKNQWKPTFFKYKLQTEYPLNVKLVEGPSTSKNRNTTYVPEVDIPTKIEIDELPLNTDEIKREYPEDEEESFSSKRFCTEDEFTLLGKEVETKVRQMRTEYGRRLVMQKIQAILHEAEAGMYDYPDSSSQENVMPVFVDCSKEVVDVSCVKEEVDETGESYGDNFDANN